jgi:hypothetical protein
MDLTRFLALLDTEALFFCRADCFEDTFEGSLSHANLAQREPVNVRKGILQIPFERMPALTAISCWSASTYESAAMWSLYCPGGSGVAVRTTFERLSRAFAACHRWKILVSRVAYRDYQTESIPDGHLLAPFLSKRRSFEHEKEVRALIQTMPDQTMLDRPSPLGDSGVNVEVSVEDLIDAVYVSPTAPNWYFQLVQRVAARFDLSADVNQSSLAGDPIY